MATVLVKDGTLKVGDVVVAGGYLRQGEGDVRRQGAGD